MLWLLKLRPADSLNVVFSFLLLVLTLIYSEAIPFARYLALLYASIIFFQIALVYFSRTNSFLALTRDMIFPVLCVLIIFDSLGMIVHNINPHDIDYLLIRIDYRIFGVYPTVFLEKLISPLLTDVLQLAYSSYYFFPVIFGVTLWVKGKREAFERSLFLILLCFYISYIGYLLFPAVGPRYAMQHLYDKELDGFLVSGPIQNVLNLLEGVKRDAFPSGHTGVALTVLLLAYRYERKLFWWMIAPVLLLIFATVYCRYHYVIDVVCGFMLTIVTVTAGEVYYNFLLRKRVPEKSQTFRG
jgi:membrane-associated phospholipid phosphatase